MNLAILTSFVLVLKGDSCQSAWILGASRQEVGSCFKWFQAFGWFPSMGVPRKIQVIRPNFSIDTHVQGFIL